jgi:ABC-type transporter Mla subunit MlaD
MEIADRGRPIHRDARLRIRPRIFLEGNFFVELQPGTGRAGELDSGATVPVSQTASPVQIDQVLTSLQSDTRADLRRLVQGLGDALAGQPSRGEDATQDADVRGETAGQALNDSLDDAPEALRGTAIVNEALQGSELHDLSRLVAGGRRVAAALARRERTLQDLISSFNRTAAAFAGEQRNLRRTVALLPEVLDAADPALDRLNASFPATRSFAREALPAVRQTPATITAALPWVEQTRRLVSPAELQGLVNELRPAIDDLSQVVDDSVTLLPQIDLIDRCLLDVVLPTGDVVIQDPPLTTGIENYKEFFQALVGLAGESQNFDGNGQYTRFQPGGGSQTVSTGDVAGTGPLFGNAAEAPLGTRPAFPGRRPPYRRGEPCHAQPPPALNAARTGSGP